jgi:hypothetical protein
VLLVFNIYADIFIRRTATTVFKLKFKIVRFSDLLYVQKFSNNLNLNVYITEPGVRAAQLV